MMKIMVQSYCDANGINLANYFRIAYVWKFDRILSIELFEPLVQTFYEKDIVPPFVVEYVLFRLQGGQHDAETHSGEDSRNEELFSERIIPRGL